MGTLYLICMFVGILSVFAISHFIGKRREGNPDAEAGLKLFTWILVACVIGFGIGIVTENNNGIQVQKDKEVQRLKQELAQKEAQLKQGGTPPPATPYSDKVIAETMQNGVTKQPTMQPAQSQSPSIFNAPNKVRLADLMGEPSKYIGKEVVIGPILITRNWPSKSEYDVIGYNSSTKQNITGQEARITYAQMEDKSKWRNLEASASTPKTVAYIRGKFNDVFGYNNTPFIVATEIVMIKE